MEIKKPIPPEARRSRFFEIAKNTALSPNYRTSEKIKIINTFYGEDDSPDYSPEEKDEIMEFLKEGQFNAIKNIMIQVNGLVETSFFHPEEIQEEETSTYSEIIEMSLNFGLLTEQGVIDLVEILEEVREECFLNMVEFIEKRQLSSLREKEQVPVDHFLYGIFGRYDLPTSYKKTIRMLFERDLLTEDQRDELLEMI
jgi:hypothetical protein